MAQAATKPQANSRSQAAPSQPQDPEQLLEQVLKNTQDGQASELLERVLRATEGGKQRFLSDALARRIEKLRSVLPGTLKGQAERLVQRALLYFASKEDLKGCPAADFVRCVLNAAELGLAIDGKLCYVVRYKSNWVCQPDYKGIVAVARRTGAIRDVYLDVVCEHDQYLHAEENGGTVFRHERPAMGQPRGEVIGAYCRILFPDGRWKVVDMDRLELDAIQRRAPSKSGPWSTDVNEMRKKTVCKRALKLHLEDAGVLTAVELDDAIEAEAVVPAVPTEAQSGTRNLRAAASRPAEDMPQEAPPEIDGEGAMATQDTFDDLSERIGKGEGEPGLQECLRAILAQAGVLGPELVAQLQAKVEERRGQLA